MFKLKIRIIFIFSSVGIKDKYKVYNNSYILLNKLN